MKRNDRRVKSRNQTTRAIVLIDDADGRRLSGIGLIMLDSIDDLRKGLPVWERP